MKTSNRGQFQSMHDSCIYGLSVRPHALVYKCNQLQCQKIYNLVGNDQNYKFLVQIREFSYLINKTQDFKQSIHMSMSDQQMTHQQLKKRYREKKKKNDSLKKDKAISDQQMTYQQLKKRYREKKKQNDSLKKDKAIAEKEGASCFNFLNKLSQSIQIGNKFEFNNIINNNTVSLPIEVQKNISSALDKAEIDTDDQEPIQINKSKPNKKWSWKHKALIIFGIILLIIAGYFLYQAGFFGWALIQLKTLVLPFLEDILVSCVSWIKTACSAAWVYLFG